MWTMGWDSIWNPAILLICFMASFVMVAGLFYTSLFNPYGDSGVDHKLLKMAFVFSWVPLVFLISFAYAVYRYRIENKILDSYPIIKMTLEQTREFVRMMTGGEKTGLTDMEIEELMETDKDFKPPPIEAPPPPRNHEVHGPFENNPHLKRMLEEHKRRTGLE